MITQYPIMNFKDKSMNAIKVKLIGFRRLYEVWGMDNWRSTMNELYVVV